MNLVENTGATVAEPDWTLLFSDEIEVAAAREHWRRVTTEMRERSILSASNVHMLTRLVTAYVLHDRSAREVAETGAVLKPRRNNARAIARLSPYFTAMRESGSDATALEAELGLSPRRRAAAAKIEKKERKVRASDSYLQPVTKG